MTNSGGRVRIEQLVHGYRRGHTLLAGSMSLDKADHELVRRLSDLSGPLPSSEQLQPYLTIYPLSNGKHYALAKTWMDRSATRPGCVLTHTLLVPMGFWEINTSPEVLINLFRSPERDELESFSEALVLESADPADYSSRLTDPMSRELLIDFVSKFFEHGISPIVWFDAPEPESIMLAIVRFLWPALRRSFSACSQSLQLRTLKNRHFDLMFAPRVRASTFDLDRKHFIHFSGHSKRAKSEPWCASVAELIMNPVLQAETHAALANLSDHPTDVRLFFVFKELEGRLSEAPAAALGMLDVVESLAPGQFDATEQKNRALQVALSVAEEFDSPTERLAFLFGVHQRLRSDCFSEVEKSFLFKFREVVSNCFQQSPEKGVSLLEQTLAPESPERASSFVIGCVEGLHELYGTNADQFLGLIDEHQGIFPHLVELKPELVCDYYRALKSAGREASVFVFADLISRVGSAGRVQLVAELLPELSPFATADRLIVDELWKGVSSESIGEILALSQFIDDFFLSALTAFGREHPEAVRRWAILEPSWDRNTAKAFAYSFEPSEAGCDALLGDMSLDKSRRAAVLAEFLSRCINEGRAGWLEPRLRRDFSLLNLILLSSRAESLRTSKISELVSSIKFIEVEHLAPLIDVLAEPYDLSVVAALEVLVVDSLILGFIAGRLSTSEYAQWQSNARVQATLNGLTYSRLKYYLCDGETSHNSYTLAMKWLTLLPQFFYEERAEDLYDMVKLIVNRGRYVWSSGLTNEWCNVLNRVSTESSEFRLIQFFVHAVDFAFRNRHLPLSAILVVAFDVVYAAVAQQKYRSEIDSLFGFFTWDRCKELRERLIESFRKSDWPPGDLALATRDADLRRKIIKRMLNTWTGGRKYLTRMCQDLANRSDSKSVVLSTEIAGIASLVDWFDDWF